MNNQESKIFCPACNSNQNKLIPYIDFPFYGNDIIDFAKLQICYCEDCGFGYSTPDVKSDLIDKFYSDVYRTSKQSVHHINFSRLKAPKISQCQAAIEHLILARHFANVQSGDLFLDIGPGPGWHFHAATFFLENPTLYALEYSEDAAAAYRKLYGVKTFIDYESLIREIKPKRMNFISASHSLEHFRYDDLKILLNQMKEILHDDGIFIIEVPYADMRIHAEIRKGDSPHLLFFSKESLRKILSDSGYEIVFLNTVGDYFDKEENATEDVKHYLNYLIRLLKFLYTKLTPLWIRKSQFKTNLKALLAYYLGSSSNLKVSQVKVCYGGNRNSLRAVARKKG
jgi:SAM-dependent methyltransferase